MAYLLQIQKARDFTVIIKPITKETRPACVALDFPALDFVECFMAFDWQFTLASSSDRFIAISASAMIGSLSLS